jgi:hypothetical protein
MTHRFAVAVAAGAAAVAAAIVIALLPTDGDPPRLTKPQYSHQVTAIFRSLGRGLRTRPTTSATLRSMTRALGRAADRLKALRPPRDGEREHRMLVESARDYTRQVDLVRASIDFGDPGTIAVHLSELNAPAAINRIIRELRTKGYRIPVRLVQIG